MARQVSNVFIRLGIENFEGIDKLKSAFRELDKSIGPSAASIDRARQAVLDYSRASGNTEQVIKGTIDALKGLQAQAERGSTSWSQISADLRAFEQQARRTDSEIDILRRGIAESVQGHAQSRSSIEAHIRSLRDLANQATLSGNTLGRVQQDIGRLEEQLNQTTAAARTSRTALNQALAVNPQAILNQWRAYTANIRDASLSAEDLAEAQRRLNILAGAPRIQERRAIAAQAEITNNPEYQRRFGVEGRAYAEGLPNTTAAFSQRLRELQEDLANTYRGTDAYLALQRELIIVQRDATAATQGLGQALLRDLQTGQAISSQRNLQEVVSTLKNEMSQLDTTTTQGFDQYTRYAADVRNLEEQIARLGRAYNTAATNAQQLSNTTENAVLNTMLNEASMGRLGRQQRARAEGMQELRQAITTGVQGTPLLLPAAGQTSAPGTGAQRSGGARLLSGQVESTFGPIPELRNRATQAFFGRPTQEVEYGQAAAAGFTRETAAAAQTAKSTGFAYRELAKDIRLVQSASANSTNTIEAQRAAWTRLQNAVDIGSNKYRLAAKRIEELDQRLGREGPRRLGGRQLAQIGGAAISGGIFGGAEGFLGGVIGGAVGGVGGSFAGAAAGAQVGMLRQQLGGTADYAAQIGKLQIALRGVTGTQDNYNQAISAAAAATRDLNIPQMEATQGITRLSAAVLGAGGSIGDANFAFRAISESIKATGGNAEQVDGALLALTQVFSKGKVSAEELNQIAERLPGTFTLFAQAAGKSGPELQKALQQGEVGLNDLMKFLELASSQYGQNALAIAGSSEEAGARMTIAFQKMSLEVGNALKPIGAELQAAFANFGTQITPQVTEAAKGIGGLLKVILDNGAAIGAIAKLVVQFGLATYALKAFTALQGPMTVALQAIALQFGTLNAQTIAAEARLKAFAATARATAASLAAPIVITLAIVGADIVLKALRDINDAQNSITKLNKELSAPEWYKAAGGSALTVQQNTNLATQVAKELDGANRALQPLLKQQEEIRQSYVTNGPGGLTDDQFKQLVERAQRDQGEPLNIGFNRFAKQLLEAQTRVDRLNAKYSYIIERLPNAPTTATRGSNFPNPVATGGGAGKTAEEKAAEQLAETERRLAEEGIKIEMDGQFKAFTYGVELDRRRYELRKQLQDEATANEIESLQGGARTVAQAFATYRSRIAELDRNLATARENVSIERERLRTSQVVAAGTGAASGRNYANVGGTGLPGGRQMLHGIPGYAGYDADHATPKNIHYHFAGKNPQETLAVAQYLKSKGYQISEFGGMGQRVGEHAEGSQHYRRNAFDIGGASLGSSDAQIQAGLKTVHALINDFLASAMGSASTGYIGSAGTTGRDRSRLLRGQRAEGKVDVAGLEVSQAENLQNLEETNDKKFRLENEKALTLALTRAYRESTAELQLSYDLEVKRTQLQKSGASTTAVDNELKLFEIRRRNAQEVERIRLEVTDPGQQQIQITAVNDALAKEVELRQKIFDLTEATANSVGFREGAQRYVESIGTLREATAGLAQQGFKGIEDSIVSLATTGTANFAQFATSLLNDMARIIIQQLVMKQLTQAIMGLFGGGGGGLGNYGVDLGLGFNQIPSFPMGSALPGFAGFTTPGLPNFTMAKGGVFAANGIVPYAMGGIVNRPTLFPFANGGAIGTGLMGEAGPEAIMPLTRGANGKLGVMAAGGGTTNVVVNVDAKGNSQVEGREDTASQLGKVVAAVVQQELVKQKRPGGLLAT